MKRISVVTPCFNEEANVAEAYRQVKEVLQRLGSYEYEHIFIDNASQDKTVPILKEIAARDGNVKIIVNARNFGWIRSPYYALLQSTGDATVLLAADLQDPPSMIAEFIRKWEEGYRVVIGVKTQSKESPLMFAIRKAYYNLVSRLSEVELIKNYTGFGLYDRQVVEILRRIDDPYPYFRGLIPELGFPMARMEYTQPKRERGITSANFYRLYDVAMLGITSHSKVPLRLATMFGFGVAAISLLVAFAYLIYKLIYWNSFSLGIAPIVIGLFFFSSVQLLFLGVVGEYIGSIQTQVMKRPLVVELERINFDEGEPPQR